MICDCGKGVLGVPIELCWGRLSGFIVYSCLYVTHFLTVASECFIFSMGCH